MSKSIKNNEPRFVGIWEPKVDVVSHGPNRSDLRRKVVTRRVARVTVNLHGIIGLLRRGNEVILTDDTMSDKTNGIRLYPCMDTSLTAMFVAAQTVGDFRHAISDMKFTVRRCGKYATSAECRKMVDEAAKRYEATQRETACPTRVVECPKCGYEFEIGGLKAK